MKHSAFTLMELLVSVVLIALITLFMYGAIASSKTTGKTLSRHGSMEHNRTLLYELFYRDLLEALWVKPLPTQNKRFTVVQMQTRNSLYDIAAPRVTYYVNAQSKQLIRLESSREIRLPVGYDDGPYIHADIMAGEVKDFNLYTATDSDGNGTVAASSPSSSSSSESLSSDEDHFAAKKNDKNEDTLPGHMFLYLDTAKLPHLLLEIAI